MTTFETRNRQSYLLDVRVSTADVLLFTLFRDDVSDVEYSELAAM